MKHLLVMTFAIVVSLFAHTGGMQAQGKIAVKVKTAPGTERSAASEASSDDVIMERPNGTATVYSRHADVYYSMFGYTLHDKELGRASEIIDGNDGYVYLNNVFGLALPDNGYETGRDHSTKITFSNVDGYLKGVRDSKNNIVLTLPQTILVHTSNDGEYPFTVTLLEPKESKENPGYYAYQPVADHCELTLTYDAETGSYSMPETKMNEGGVADEVLGAVYDDGGWAGFAEFNSVWSPATDKVVQIPENGYAQKWEYNTTVYENYGYVERKQLVDVVLSGYDIYVKGLDRNMPDSWIKGEMDKETRATYSFPANQYLGIDPNTCHHIYFKPSVFSINTDNYWGNTYESFKFLDNMTMNLSMKDGLRTLTPATDSLCMVFNADKDEIYDIDNARFPSLRQRPNSFSKIPATPAITSFEKIEDPTQITLTFVAEPQNVDGLLLEKDRLHYNLLQEDGTPFVFSTAEYMGLTEDMTDIPFGYTDPQQDIYNDEEINYIMIYDDDIKRIGVQVYYTDDDGQVYKSEPAWATLDDPTAVEGVTGGNHKPASVSFYSIDGRRMSKAGNEKGIVLKITTYNDGSRKAERIIR